MSADAYLALLANLSGPYTGLITFVRGPKYVLYTILSFHVWGTG